MEPWKPSIEPFRPIPKWPRRTSAGAGLTRLVGSWKRPLALSAMPSPWTPKLAEAYLGRGVAHSLNEDYSRAILDFSKSIQLDPDLTLAYYNRGVAYTRTEDYQSALEDFFLGR